MRIQVFAAKCGTAPKSTKPHSTDRMDTSKALLLVCTARNRTSGDFTGRVANRGVFDPPQVGEFKNGRGEFIAQDTLNGKTILIRFEWTNLNTESPHFEQLYSEDGGKSWKVNWITDQKRISETP